MSLTKNKTEIRGADPLLLLHSLFLLLPLLSSSSLSPQLPSLWYPAVIAVLPFALATTIAANFATAVAAISSPCHHVALSCHISFAIVLAAVIAASPPLLLLLFLPPYCPHPGSCCCRLRHHCCHATPVLAAADAAISRCPRRIAPALAVLAGILATTTFPPLLLTPPLKLIFLLIVMSPQLLTLLPPLFLSLAAVDVDCWLLVLLFLRSLLII